jgi:hypothetical protein
MRFFLFGTFNSHFLFLEVTKVYYSFYIKIHQTNLLINTVKTRNGNDEYLL